MTPPPTASESAIAGVRVRQLQWHLDGRGGFVELHRSDVMPGTAFVQWNYLASAAGVLRGIHVHRRHSDLLFLLEGRMRLGLKDLRRASPTTLVEEVRELDAADGLAIAIPNGVAHGFYLHTAARLLFAVDAYFDPADELACRWDDPGIGLFRGIPAPLLSERDADAPSLAALCASLWP